MKINDLKKAEELTLYSSAKVRDAASKEDLHEVLVAFDKYIQSMQLVRNLVYKTLQDKLCRTEQLSLEFDSCLYVAKKDVEKKFLNDFTSTEDEAKLLEDFGFNQFVSRTEEVVNKTKIDRTNLKKAYLKNTLPEAVASHYKFDEKEKLNIVPPKAIPKPIIEEE